MTKLAALPEAGASSVVFFGTPQIAVAYLEALVANKCKVQLVVTRPDVRRSRGNEMTASPVKVAAQKLGIAVTHSLEEVTALADKTERLLGVVVAFGEVIPMSVLAQVPMINVHFSLLPRWRGAAPVERAILAGDATTGVCIMRVGEKLDEGDVFARREVLISNDDTAESLKKKLSAVSIDLLIDAVRNGSGQGVAQSGDVIYAKKIKPIDLQIDWRTSTEQILRQVRVGGAFSFVNGKRLKVLRATSMPNQTANKAPGMICVLTKTECVIATSDSAVSLLEVQPEGKAAISVEVWMHGARLTSDLIFGS